MIESTPSPALRLVRIPGESGPILRCSGELSVATAEALRRELALLIELGHPSLIINLSACTRVDIYGIATVVEACEQLRLRGRRAALVAGEGSTARLLRELRLMAVLPLYRSEENAATALRGSGRPPLGPGSWDEAREHTLRRWQAIDAALDQGDLQPALRLATSMFGLCARAEELYQVGASPTSTRCYCCPLFFELGARRADVGCRSAIDPLLRALRQHDWENAQAQVAEIIWMLERLPLPPERPEDAEEHAVLDGGRRRRTARRRTARRTPGSALPRVSER